MENEKTAIESLDEYAKQTGRKAEINEYSYPIVRGIRHFRRSISIPDSEVKDTYFVSFQDTKEFGKYELYSGMFFPVPKAQKLKVTAQKKSVLNKLNLLKKDDRFRTGNSSFDSKVLIKASNSNKAHPFFKSKRVQELIVKALELDPKLHISINAMDITYVEALKGKAAFGIFIPRKWILDTSVIDQLFNITKELNQLIGVNKGVEVI